MQLSALVLFCAAALAQTQADLYGRVEKRLSGDPQLAAGLNKPSPQMAEIAWMKGEWVVESVVTAGSGTAPERGTSSVSPALDGIWLEVRDNYPSGTRDLNYIGYSAGARRWLTIAIDGFGNANVASSEGWHGNRIIFEGDFVVLGEKAHLRQTMTKLGLDLYQIDNDELLPDGSWKHLDSYRYTRKRQP